MGKSLKKIWKEIEELPYNELFDLFRAYNNYVIETTSVEDVPVCAPEFYENEYQERKAN